MGSTRKQGTKAHTGGHKGRHGGRKVPGKEQGMKRTQRFERRLKDAKEGNEIEVLKGYKQEIEKQRIRMNASKNSFISQAHFRMFVHEADGMV